METGNDQTLPFDETVDSLDHFERTIDVQLNLIDATLELSASYSSELSASY